MHGLMMDMPLLISDLIRHADRHHGDGEIVSKTVEGGMHRYTYREAHARARASSRSALERLGVAHARPRRARSPGTASGTSRSTTPSSGIGRGDATPSTRACSPTRSPTSSTTPRTRSLFFDLTSLPLVEKLAPQLQDA